MKSIARIFVNGASTESISAADRGLHYGDGLFETLPVASGEALCLDRHLDRLARGCRRLALPPPDRILLRDEIRRSVRSAARDVLKIIVTRGEGGRGYGPPPETRPTRLIIDYPWPEYPAHYREKGVSVRVCATRLARNPALAGLKHLNRLEQVLARAECVTWDLPEGIMLDTAGYVIEGTMSNLFLVNQGELLTPDLSQCGVDGIVRGLIVDIVRSSTRIRVHARTVRPGALFTADEVFLCNSLFGIWPVTRIEEHEIPVGPVTRWLQHELVERGAIIAG